MPIKLVPHSREMMEAVAAFNGRMRAGGSPWGFYVDPQPDWIPKQEGAVSWREYHLALEDGEHVRGGYALKPQQWLIHGKIEWVTDWQGPFTEALIDARYSSLALRIIRDMLKKHPLLFSLGHGGSDEPIVQLLEKLGWTLHGTSACLRILKPYRFLRLNQYLRKTHRNAAILDLLAYSGIGSAGIASLHKTLSIWHRRGSSRCRAEVVEIFGDWADELWERNKTHYDCLAVRDQQMMNTLLPVSGWPGGIRLKVYRGDELIGWTVVHDKQMTDDPRFGDLRVGLLSDCFGAPQDAADIISATHDFLSARNVDLVFSNQSHPGWISGFRNNGYVILPKRRVFAISPALEKKLDPLPETVAGLHLTNMDGHGPHGFTD